MKTKLLFIAFSLTVWFSFSQIPDYLPQNGLVAWYPFNNNFNDESGNGNDGSSSGTITFIDDKDSNNLSSVQLGSGSVLLPQIIFPYTREETFSISFWFTHSSTSNARLMSTECPEGNFRITNNSSVSGGFSIQYGDYQNLSLSNPTEWNHVVYVYNSRNEEVYLNGVLEVTNYDSVTQAISYCHPLTLGAKASNPNNDRWNGEIDDIGFWNRPLTSQEVSQLYTGNAFAQDIELNGTISAEDNQIKNLLDPTDAQDAVTLSVLLEKISELQDQIDNAQIGSITDVDGNTYNSLAYGNQAWTVENTEVVTYRDGTSIPQVTANDEWESLTTGAWCYYENDETKPRLYNWYAVMGIHDPASLSNPSQRKEFAPEGWHVPSDAEWTTLEEYLIANEYNYDGTTTKNKIAKAMSSTTGWNSSTNAGAVGNNQSLNNSSGFNGFPEGNRFKSGSFKNEGNLVVFWSSTEDNTGFAWNHFLINFGSNIYRDDNTKQNGFSVRFVRD